MTGLPILQYLRRKECILLVYKYLIKLQKGERRRKRVGRTKENLFVSRNLINIFY